MNKAGKYYKFTDGHYEYIVKVFHKHTLSKMGITHSNSLILFENGKSTGGWWRTYTKQQLKTFERLDDKTFQAFELELQMKKHLK